MIGAGDADDEGSFRIAEWQAGAIGNRQLRAGGLTGEEIRGLLGRRVLRASPARGVYRIAGAERTWKQDLWVALLAGPDGTLASHLSAAALRDLLSPPAMPHVTVPRWANGKFGGAVIHHATVGAADRGTWGGVEATALGRTIVDCAAVLDQTRLNALVDAAFGKGLCTNRKVREAWERAGRVRGGPLIEAVLEPYSGGAEPGSVKAAHVLGRISDWGLPMPECEYRIHDAHGGFIARVDFIWRSWWFILEYEAVSQHDRSCTAAL